ncbi:putative Clr5 domain-containing protein [Seiridium cardinale]|uniref:Clr5 domain-containing protein n=1 Tax=Seiridium cardinale TaxID=138064 RepID=A0ABR2X8H8_9PEZI
MFSIRQYKHRLKKWGVTKSVPSDVKEQAIQVLGKRVRNEVSVGGIRHNDVEIKKPLLQRYLREQSKKEHDWHLETVIFAHWNLPYKALKASSMHNLNVSSPFNMNHPTPSDYSVLSPQQISNESDAMNAPSPTTVAIRAKIYRDRVGYLLQGKSQEFLKDMPASEKSIATTWLHQFWLFAFSTAKYWGRGPTHWNADLLAFMKFPDTITLPHTPSAESGISPQPWVSSSPGSRQLPGGRSEYAPSPLCRWAIHYHEPDYDAIPSPPVELETEFDINGSDHWPQWNQEALQANLVDRLQYGLESNSFSNIHVEDLPLSATQVAVAASRSPSELQAEAVGFAIMAQNEGLLYDLLNKEDLDLTRLYPFHLAATYLNGAKTCCNIMWLLMKSLVRHNRIMALELNELGHTVLDSLMISILKGHTSCMPGVCDDKMRNSQRFVGEEVNICGRWDADSHCIRSLNAHGIARVPSGWKHMFCHTSAQAICHTIPRVFSFGHSPDINTPSGLFIKFCEHCNQKLQLGPLHTLVVTAFYLAQQGCEGETLFGALACLVCLLVYGADPLQEAEVSLRVLMGAVEGASCSHAMVNPFQLADQVPPAICSRWAPETQLGWSVFISVLRYAANERHETNGDENEVDRGGCDHDDGYNSYGKSATLGKLWAAIQAELLTYRRAEEGDGWLSENFSMEAVLNALGSESGMDTLPLIQRSMLKPFCKCGRFLDAEDQDCPTSEEACTSHFSNLDNWSRSSFIESLPYI